MNKAEVQAIRNQLLEGIKAIEIEGHEIKLGRCTYGVDAQFKLTVQPIGHDQAAEDFKTHCYGYGLSPDHLGKELPDGGGKIVGMKTRNTKYPILVERNGKRYKYPARTIKALLSS